MHRFPSHNGPSSTESGPSESARHFTHNSRSTRPLPTSFQSSDFGSAGYRGSQLQAAQPSTSPYQVYGTSRPTPPSSSYESHIGTTSAPQATPFYGTSSSSTLFSTHAALETVPLSRSVYSPNRGTLVPESHQSHYVSGSEYRNYPDSRLHFDRSTARHFHSPNQPSTFGDDQHLSYGQKQDKNDRIQASVEPLISRNKRNNSERGGVGYDPDEALKNQDLSLPDHFSPQNLPKPQDMMRGQTRQVRPPSILDLLPSRSFASQSKVKRPAVIQDYQWQVDNVTEKPGHDSQSKLNSKILRDSSELLDAAWSILRSRTASSSPTVSLDIDLVSVSGDSEDTNQTERNSQGYRIFSQVFQSLVALGLEELMAKETLTSLTHALERSCTRGPSAKLEGISQQQKNQLSLKSKGSVEQQWYTVWSILFPDMEPPATIYIYSTQSEDFCRIQEFAQREGVAIMLDELESNGLVVRPDASNPLLRSTVQRAMVSIFRSYSIRREPSSEAEDQILGQALEPENGESLQQGSTTGGQIDHGNLPSTSADVNRIMDEGMDDSGIERLDRPSRSSWSRLPTMTSWLLRGAVQDNIEDEPWGPAFPDEPAFGESSSGNDLPFNFESSELLDFDALLRDVISTEA
ncbi:uncharacterized protein FFB20_14377 [Fusarium fujikuroi]|nr:uncharacterized protein FFC1_05416 [Fusarium fujikuroi]SCO13782.1 uncharacterized protein FFB20_14377 [Fusarium fujikuroi]SCO42289.1 uncharacterized protein FFNC_08439 [Fusarium fujikuroi]